MAVDNVYDHPDQTVHLTADMQIRIAAVTAAAAEKYIGNTSFPTRVKSIEDYIRTGVTTGLRR